MVVYALLCHTHRAGAIYRADRAPALGPKI